MAIVTIHEAKTHLSRLLRRVAAGEEIVIARDQTPVARLVPIGGRPKRSLGFDEGSYVVPSDFDDPLPPDVLDSFQ